MADRYRTMSGWTVDVVERSGTPNNCDGQQLRIRYHGFYVADVRTVAELEQYFPLTDLEPDGLASQQRGGVQAATWRGIDVSSIDEAMLPWLSFRKLRCRAAIGSGSPALLIAAASLRASSANPSAQG